CSLSCRNSSAQTSNLPRRDACKPQPAQAKMANAPTKGHAVREMTPLATFTKNKMPRTGNRYGASNPYEPFLRGLVCDSLTFVSTIPGTSRVRQLDRRLRHHETRNTHASQLERRRSLRQPALQTQSGSMRINEFRQRGRAATATRKQAIA